MDGASRLDLGAVPVAQAPAPQPPNDERRAAARFYSEALKGVDDLVLPPAPAGNAPVWHLYVIRTSRVRELARFLGNRRIGTGRHHPDPVHLTDAYAHLAYKRGTVPGRRSARARVPVAADVSDAQLEAVVGGVRAFFDG